MGLRLVDGRRHDSAVQVGGGGDGVDDGARDLGASVVARVLLVLLGVVVELLLGGVHQFLGEGAGGDEVAAYLREQLGRAEARLVGGVDEALEEAHQLVGALHQACEGDQVLPVLGGGAVAHGGRPLAGRKALDELVALEGHLAPLRVRQLLVGGAELFAQGTQVGERLVSEEPEE